MQVKKVRETAVTIIDLCIEFRKRDLQNTRQTASISKAKFAVCCALQQVLQEWLGNGLNSKRLLVNQLASHGCYSLTSRADRHQDN
jgi:hypothetical protein